MFADDVAIPNLKVAARASEVLIQRIGAQRGSGGYLVVFSQRSPRLYENIRLQAAECADLDILFNHAKFANHALWSHARAGMNTRGGGHCSGRVDGHNFVS